MSKKGRCRISKRRLSQAVPRGPPIWIWIFDYPPDLGCEIRGKTRFSQYLGSEKIIQLRFSYRSVVIARIALEN